MGVNDGPQIAEYLANEVQRTVTSDSMTVLVCAGVTVVVCVVFWTVMYIKGRN